MNRLSEKSLRKQKIYFALAIGVAVVLIFGAYEFIGKHYRSPSYHLFEKKIDLPIDEFKEKEVWMDRLEAQVNFLSQKQKYYEETLLEYKEKDCSNEEEKLELKRYLTELKKELEEAKHQSLSLQAHPDLSQGENLHALNLPSSPFISLSSPQSQQRENQRTTLRPPLCVHVMAQEEKERVFSIEKRTPANVSVKAILISSIDAVCRLEAQSDPIPVKLRLLDDGYLPGGNAAKLKGCLIGGSAYGDISSERVYIRLENLVQVNPGGQAVETEVTGYVSGEDGRFGMRGIVVDRSSKILKPALGSGVLSGISKALQSVCLFSSKEKFNPQSIAKGVTEQAAISASDAFSLLASYYIKRAEQVQPVLQIEAGRIVDVTFTQGFSLGDLHSKENFKIIRGKNRRDKNI